MDNNRKEIINKIMKLMARTTSRGATEAEAINAALIAQKMMNDNDIKQSELHEDEEELIIDKACEIGSKKSFYTSLAAVIAPNFRCKAYCTKDYHGNNHVHFYGFESDTEAADIIFKHLYNLGNRIANRECRKAKKEFGTTTGVYNSFALGFLQGVQDELEKQAKALMVITPKEVTDKWDEEFASTHWRKGRQTSVRSSNLDASTYATGRRTAVDGIRSRRIEGRMGLPQ